MSAIELLARDASEIVDAATEMVLRVRVRHYADEGRDALRGHVEDLYGRLLACMESRDASTMVLHARAIAGERFATGFGLHEVQTAINVIEEIVWRHLEAKLPPDELVEAIRLVSSILGMGKDALATRYVALAAGAHAPAVDTGRLFRGTDGV